MLVISIILIANKLLLRQLPSDLIAGSGRIDGDLIVLNTKYPARVKNIFVAEGEPVKKGQVLAELDSKEQEISLMQKAQTDLKRNKMIHDEKAIPDDLFEKIKLKYISAKNEYNAAILQKQKIELAIAQANLEKISIEHCYYDADYFFKRCMDTYLCNATCIATAFTYLSSSLLH
ncbi:efflux RND transporter periplasmic adaptor subunit [Sulfurimonas sp. NWX79]|uniref:efflux RND transporter periplasmic adaptor subunit n=1 Tax=Sulfurimonas sp. NWX79 TaxID=2925412 RepID=UPI003204ABEC